MSIEQDLDRALRRKAAPSDLADRVLARIDETERREGPRLAHGNAVRRSFGGYVQWLAAAAAVTLVATGGVRYYTYQQTMAEAERVKQDIRLALQITSEKLTLAQERIARSADSPR
jgi:hypothetical protein